MRLDPRVWKAAKKAANESGKKLASFVEDALRTASQQKEAK